MEMLYFAVLLGLSVLFNGYFILVWYSLPLTVFALYLVTGGWKKVWILYLTFGRDLRFITGMLSVRKNVLNFIKARKTMGEAFHEVYAKHPERVALIEAENGIRFTYRQMETLSNKIANVFRQEGLKKGDCMCLIMDACPEYVCYWIGLSRIGVTVALLNTSLRGHALAHCINVAKAKGIIYQDYYGDTISSASSSFDEGMQYYCTSGSTSIKDSTLLPQLIIEASTSLPPKTDGQGAHDPFLYMYTSGTSGLPKAAIITHRRYFQAASAFITLFGFKSSDILYAPLPIYHGTAGLPAIGNCFVNGITCVIRSKFSASHYIKDCARYNATVAFYVGELCRYILSQPPKTEDKGHRLRMAVGNGLRREIWKEFQRRFSIPRICEFYGSTEGGGICNNDNTPYSLGFLFNIWLPKVNHILVKVREDTGEILRGSNGLAIVCKANEPGEVLFFSSDDPLGKYECYVNQESTRKKFTRDIVKKGDAFFRSGDILVADEFGYLYFVDRAGDTFRWKSENVATTEVESIISEMLGKRDVAVYGVKVPGCEGKAGMVTIADPEGDVDMRYLGEELKKELAVFAMPLFAKVSKSLPTTATFKYCKVEECKIGYNPSVVGDDSLYFYDSKAGRYVTLDDELYQKIMNCELRL